MTPRSSLKPLKAKEKCEVSKSTSIKSLKYK